DRRSGPAACYTRRAESGPCRTTRAKEDRHRAARNPRFIRWRGGQHVVNVGEYVSPGTRLLIYHDPNIVWVDANVKETDFGRIEIGAPVTISVDAYPGIEFTGEVVRLGHAATS